MTTEQEALRQCRDQFQFYADEHRRAGKDEKAATNQRFADLCSAALAHPQSTPNSLGSHFGNGGAFDPQRVRDEALEEAAKVADSISGECADDEHSCDIDDEFGAIAAFGGKIEARRIAAAIRQMIGGRA